MIAGGGPSSVEVGHGSTALASPGAEQLPTPKPPPLLRLLVFTSYIGVVILEPELPGNGAVVDLILAAAVVIAMASTLTRGTPATASLGRALPWLWLIIVGSIGGLTTVGMTGWALSNMVRGLFAILTFFMLWHLIEAYRLHRAAANGAVAALLIATFFLMTQPYRYRAAGLFPHANYASHFAVLTTAVVLASTKNRRLQGLALVCLAITLAQTGSFGALAMGATMATVQAARTVSRNTTALLTAVLVLVVGLGLFLTAPDVEETTSVEGNQSWQLNPSLSQERFEKSRGSRFEIWGNAFNAYTENPLGVGPDGVRSRGFGVTGDRVLEIHSDSFGYLVERGPLGLIGYIGLWAVIWRTARRGGVARLLIAAMLMSGLFRETMHYRHGWVALAVAMAIDHQKARAALAPAAVGSDRPPVAIPTRGVAT